MSDWDYRRESGGEKLPEKGRGMLLERSRVWNDQRVQGFLDGKGEGEARGGCH